VKLIGERAPVIVAALSHLEVGQAGGGVRGDAATLQILQSHVGELNVAPPFFEVPHLPPEEGLRHVSAHRLRAGGVKALLEEGLTPEERTRGIAVVDSKGS
jgi:hypothetical protein